MPRVLKLVDVGPNLRLPSTLMRCRFPASGATRVQRDLDGVIRDRHSPGKFDENASDLFDLFISPQDVLISQQVAESQFLGLCLGLGSGVKWTILRPQLLGGVTRHPERLFVGHCSFRPGLRTLV